MIRNCFLCADEVEVRAYARWSLPGLEAQELGFGLCRGCGLVLQSPAVAPAELERWYAESAVYTSPGRDGSPHPRKVRGTTRLVNMVRHALGHAPASVFQVGCSDGYSLSRFREAGTLELFGLDPGEASCRLASERYGLDVMRGTIEDQRELPDAELWLLTHVLEHLWDPLAVLRRARAQPGCAWLAIEVPLFERPDVLPPGYLSFEHLNYFTEETLARTLDEAGFEIVSLAKEYADDLYPIVAAMARPRDGVRAARRGRERVGEYERARARLDGYLERERSAWRRVTERLHAELAPGARVYLWGAGVHASQLLAGTDLATRAEIVGVIDSAPEKRGTRLGDLGVVAPQDLVLAEGDTVVIASFASADEIWRGLAPERGRGVRVVRPHGDDGDGDARRRQGPVLE